MKYFCDVFDILKAFDSNSEALFIEKSEGIQPSKVQSKAQPTELTEPEVRDNMWSLTVMDASVEVSGDWRCNKDDKCLTDRGTVGCMQCSVSEEVMIGQLAG